MIQLTLLSRDSPAKGTQKIEWDSQSYRETITSAGARTVRGIQGGRAYYTDEDGVTRVVSDPVLAQLTTRSFFWRRAWLFEDAERARVSLGPADAATVAVRLLPHGGNSLELTFSRRDLRLMSARSPGLDLRFDAPGFWQDGSRRGRSVRVEHRSTGLPTGALADAAIGGWSSVWKQPSAEGRLVATPSGAVAVGGTVDGEPAVVAVEAGVDGPMRVRPDLARRLGWTPRQDVFGRQLHAGARVEIGAWGEPSIFAEVTEEVPAGADVAIGGALFREAIVEYAGDRGVLRLHDPEKWVRPEGYYRCVVDDDGDRPVAILRKKADTLRVTAGETQRPALMLAEESASRVGLAAGARSAEGLRWGAAPLPPLDLERLPGATRFDPASGDDGRLSAAFLVRFRAVIDMTHRWAYLKPESGAVPKGD